ncbi:hypothetical protein VTK26DRAFT_3924 [Humicola hyalothermophila]
MGIAHIRYRSSTDNSDTSSVYNSESEMSSNSASNASPDPDIQGSFHSSKRSGKNPAVVHITHSRRRRRSRSLEVMRRRHRRSPNLDVKEAPIMGRKNSSFWDELGRLGSDFERAPGKPLVRATRLPTGRTRTAGTPGPGAGPSPDNSADYGPFNPPSQFTESEPEDSEESDKRETFDSKTPGNAQPSAFEGTDHPGYIAPYVPGRRTDIVFDPSQANKDITVTVEMELEEDRLLDLDDFTRLARLGRFKDAKAYFTATLEHRIINPWIQLSYAEMLLDCGDYTSLRSLCTADVVFPASPGPDAVERYYRNLT